LQSESRREGVRCRVSADHLGRLEEQRRRDGEAQGLGGLKVDHQLEFRGLLDRQIGWFGTIENLAYEGAGAAGQTFRVQGKSPTSQQ
jgi:hypothetical protein